MSEPQHYGETSAMSHAGEYVAIFILSFFGAKLLPVQELVPHFSPYVVQLFTGLSIAAASTIFSFFVRKLLIKYFGKDKD
ncbi:MAG TPA: hypothetical protein VEF04_20040 [Blastocatellia bacterium]|nr:hypothetical protein [Blastocatellia bacterium]